MIGKWWYSTSVLTEYVIMESDLFEFRCAPRVASDWLEIEGPERARTATMGN